MADDIQDLPLQNLSNLVPLGAGTAPPPQLAPQEQAEQQGATVPPPRPGTGIGTPPPPQNKADFFRKMLGDFFYAAGTGLANTGHGPGSFERGLGSGLEALPQRDIAMQHLAIQRQQAQAAEEYRKAQAQALTPSIRMLDPQGNEVMVPPAHVGQALAAQYRLAGTQATVAGRITTQAMGDTSKEKQTEEKITSQEKQTAAKLTTSRDLSADKLAAIKAALENKEKYQDASLKLRQAGYGMRVQEFAQKQDALGGPAQQVLIQTTPAHDQIQDLIKQFAPLKDDNTPFKYAGERAKYALGMHSDITNAADTIAQLELNKVAGAARVMKGSSRSIQALQMAMTHLPNVWKDSPQLIYSKLENLDKALGQIEDDAYKYGKKTGVVPQRSAASSPAAGNVIRYDANGNRVP